jgi:Fe-S-cluster-containing hydrogenase component 2
LQPLVVADRCTGCWECIEVCPRDAIEPLDGSRLAVMASAATGRSRL